jgi:starch synthase (maltosyl-transferring)
MKERRFPRIWIDRVEPAIDGGRTPVKRVVGESVAVEADLLKDGHDLLAARVRHRGPGERSWRFAPMRYDADRDTWVGSFVVDRVGRWSYAVESWTDHFETWRDELEKKLAAGVDVSSELLEGAELVAAAAKRLPRAERDALLGPAERLREASRATSERAREALDPGLRALVATAPDLSASAISAPELAVTVDREIAGFASWYETFPRSSGGPGRHGTFADAARDLERIAALGFDVVYLPPIHPIGRTNRKGKNNSLVAAPDDVGSPWAIGAAEGGHDAVHPDLGTLADFDRYVARARELGLEVALDFALQCTPDHPWVRDHPDWFFVRPDGTIKYAENPPKKYQDIYPLNFWCEDWPSLWEACRDVVLHWIRHGVNTFRVDNPHTKPFAFWQWLIAEVQTAHPGTVFLSEAFTRPKRMKALAKLGFTQSYTYFTWRNGAAELREYLTELTSTEVAEYFRGNLFVNTPDILHEYLQEGGPPAFRVRLLLAGTLSPLYGIYSGFELFENVPLREGSEEYLDSEKYQLRPRDFAAPGNLDREIALLNRIRRENAALRLYRNLSFHLAENERILFYRKSAPGNDLLIAVNLNPHAAEDTMVHVPIAELGIAPDQAYAVEDLLTGARYLWRGTRNYVRLDPFAAQAGHVLRVVREPT